MERMGSPLAGALKYMVLASALYEPLRSSLHRLEEEVGGVGGVGGLCNMGNPGACKSLAGETGNYCFKPGVFAGLTAFAIVVLLAWSLPIFLACLRTSFMKSPVTEDEPDRDVEHGLLKVWTGLSCLWFAMPFAAMLVDPFYQSPLGFVLALALAAAFPLSWHLSFLALPVNKAITPLLGIARCSVINLHKAIAWRTVFWGSLHALGELIYLMAHGGFLKIFQLRWQHGENLLYLVGVASALLLLSQALLATVRFSLPKFKQYHRAMAVVLLLSATAHWTLDRRSPICLHAVTGVNHLLQHLLDTFYTYIPYLFTDLYHEIQ